MGTKKKSAKTVLAKNIVERRNKLGWTAERLAEKATIPYPTLRDIEAGVSNGRLETRELIARALQCSVADLHKERDGAPAIPDFESAASFLAKFSTLSPVRQRFLLAVVFQDESYLVGEPLLSQAYRTLSKAPGKA